MQERMEENGIREMPPPRQIRIRPRSVGPRRSSLCACVHVWQKDEAAVCRAVYHEVDVRRADVGGLSVAAYCIQSRRTAASTISGQRTDGK